MAFGFAVVGLALALFVAVEASGDARLLAAVIAAASMAVWLGGRLISYVFSGG